jgi:membrane protease YdiL (CAAX protease family)
MNTEISLPVKRPFNWKGYLFLVVILIPSVYAVLPYSLSLTSTTLNLDEWLSFLALNMVNVAIYAALAAIGLFLGTRIGLGLPFVERWVKKEPVRDIFLKVLVFSIIAGAVVGVVIIVLDVVIFGPLLQAEFQNLHVILPETANPPAWQGFLASFYGGIVEEVLLRLFLMTALAFLGSLVFRDSEGRPTGTVLWSANILAAIIFGLGHLPTALAIGVPLTTLFITRTVVLNGLGGVVFGWLYWTRGLESAMVAHFSTDIVLHVLFVMILSLL